MKIAERTLYLRDPDGNKKVLVSIFLPEADGSAWLCRYNIDWPENTRSSFAAGVDGVQALNLVLQKIGIDLYMSSYHASGRLIWEKADDGYGFPVPNNGREFLIGSDKLFEG